MELSTKNEVKKLRNKHVLILNINIKKATNHSDVCYKFFINFFISPISFLSAYLIKLLNIIIYGFLSLSPNVFSLFFLPFCHFQVYIL